jgi:hypothetical protein
MEHMNTLYVDSTVSDDVRREKVFQGQLFLYSPTPGSKDFVAFARALIVEAFGSLDPLTAQDHLSVEEYARILGELKPAFIHHPGSKECIRRLLCDLNADLEATYFDVPRMRTSTSSNYLTSGIAYAYEPHRDTWCSAPSCQINWWIPIYDITADNGMAFHPRYWTQPVQNDSCHYDYGDWVKKYRYIASKLLKEETRPFPRATEPLELDPQLRLVCPAGGIVVFSAAHLHSSVPNTSGHTRFSIDFRTVNLNDAKAFRGAPNLDAQCTGTTMNDYLRGTDLEHFPPELIARYSERGADRRRSARGVV